MSYVEAGVGEHRAPPRQRRYMGTAKVAIRYDKSLRTVQRWIVEPPMGMPKPKKHNGRWLWDADELDAYDDARA